MIEIDTIAEHLAQDILNSSITDLKGLERKIKVALSLALPSVTSKGLKGQHARLLEQHRLMKLKLQRHAMLQDEQLRIFKKALEEKLTIDERVDVYYEEELSRSRLDLSYNARTKDALKRSLLKKDLV